MTVTSQVAVLPPSSVFTVMVALPAFIAVTLPFDTEATELLLDDHVTFLFVALSGLTVAVRVSSSPSVRVADDLSNVTPVTGYTLAFTVTSQVAALPPSSVLTVIVALPAFNAVTLPFDTEAMERLLLLHITVLFSASFGEIVATRVADSPSVNSIDVALR